MAGSRSEVQARQDEVQTRQDKVQVRRWEASVREDVAQTKQGEIQARQGSPTHILAMLWSSRVAPRRLLSFPEGSGCLRMLARENPCEKGTFHQNFWRRASSKKLQGDLFGGSGNEFIDKIYRVSSIYGTVHDTRSDGWYVIAKRMPLKEWQKRHRICLHDRHTFRGVARVGVEILYMTGMLSTLIESGWYQKAMM